MVELCASPAICVLYEVLKGTRPPYITADLQLTHGASNLSLLPVSCCLNQHKILRMVNVLALIMCQFLPSQANNGPAAIDTCPCSSSIGSFSTLLGHLALRHTDTLGEPELITALATQWWGASQWWGA